MKYLTRTVRTCHLTFQDSETESRPSGPISRNPCNPDRALPRRARRNKSNSVHKVKQTKQTCKWGNLLLLKKEQQKRDYTRALLCNLSLEKVGKQVEDHPGWNDCKIVSWNNYCCNMFAIFFWETDFYTPPGLEGAALFDSSAPAVYKIQGP